MLGNIISYLKNGPGVHLSLTSIPHFTLRQLIFLDRSVHLSRKVGLKLMTLWLSAKHLLSSKKPDANVSAQKPGRVYMPVNNHENSFKFLTFFISEPCQSFTTNLHVNNYHLHQRPHFGTFWSNNY